MKNNLRKHFAIFIALVLMLTAMPLAGMASQRPDKADQPPVSIENYRKRSLAFDEKYGDEKAASETEETKKEKTKIDVFGFAEKDVAALYKAYSGKFMVTPIYKEKDKESFESFVKLLGMLNDSNTKAVEEDRDDIAEDIEASFLLVLKDGTRRVYTLNKNNLMQAAEKGFVTIPAEVYNNLLELYKKDYQNVSFAQWIIFMIPKNVTRISYEDQEVGKPAYIDEKNISAVVQEIRRTAVANGESYHPVKRDFNPGGGKTRIMLYFDDVDGYYTIWLDGTTMYVESSDLHIGTKYTITASQSQNIINTLKNPVSTAA